MDSSSNKGGVTSSSLEVFAALAMDPEQHDEYLTVQTDGMSEPPLDYVKYVKCILNFIQQNAKLEFNAIWSVTHDHDMTKCEASKVLSLKINNLADYIDLQLDMRSDLANKVLRRAIPTLLVDLCGFQAILTRVPDNYLKAVAAVWIASRYVYKYGINASEFNFYRFMRSIELDELGPEMGWVATEPLTPSSLDHEAGKPVEQAPTLFRERSGGLQ